MKNVEVKRTKEIKVGRVIWKGGELIKVYKIKTVRNLIFSIGTAAMLNVHVWGYCKRGFRKLEWEERV